MGAFGPGLFQDDLALDVRDAFRELLGSGRSDAGVVSTIRAELAGDGDPEDGAVVALALAALQWQYGRLDREVLAAALDVIDRGVDLQRWEGSKQHQKREQVLNGLRAKLLSPQPRRSTPRRPRQTEVPAHHTNNADGSARATAFQLIGADPGGPRMQVTVEHMVDGQRGGGGVFAARCEYHHIHLRWLASDLLEVSHPSGILIDQQKRSSFYSGRTVNISYVEREHSSPELPGEDV